MKILPTPKHQILIRSLRKQLSIMVRNLYQFGISLQEIYSILIEVIFSHQGHQNPEDSKQSLSSQTNKLKILGQNLTVTNLVDSVINEIRSHQISDKLLLRCLQNVYAQNSSLTEESLISLTPAIQTTNETENKFSENMKRMSSQNKKTSHQSKLSYEEALIQRSRKIFEREQFFSRRKSSFQNDQQYDDDEALEWESSRITSRMDPLSLMQQEISRLREMQLKYQKELETKVVEKKKLLDKLNNPLSMQNRPEFTSIYQRNMQY